MSYRFLFSAFLLIAMTCFSGCEIIGGIFKAGVWTGVIIIAIVVGLIGYGIYALINRK